jgi:hypothetical protein
METILSRAMSDPGFADLLFSQPDKALSEYNLPVETIESFKKISRTRFDAITAEDRRSMATGRSYVTGHFELTLDGLS